MDEITLLLQGKTLPAPQLTAQRPLPPARERESSVPNPPMNPHTFKKPPDTTGMALVRKRGSTTRATSALPAPALASTSASQDPVASTSSMDIGDFTEEFYVDPSLEEFDLIELITENDADNPPMVSRDPFHYHNLFLIKATIYKLL